jgi:ankyrin repeat protein
LPETLDETYQRTLREIDKANWEFALRLFQFVAVASRPPRVEELAELLAFDFKAGPIPKFREDWRMEDPVHAVLSTCSSLLAIVDGGRPSGKVIQFSHFSVKEYLTSSRLGESSDIIPRRYHVSMTPAHSLAAQACLGILLHLDKDVVSRDSPKKWPLAEYAAEHWADHARFGDVSRNVEDGMKQLFDPNKPHLSVSIWIHDPAVLPWEKTRRAEKPLPLKTSLHYAALWGFDIVVDFLVIEHSQDLHGRGFTDNATPLHLASKRGHVKASRMLIDYGADVTMQNENGETPLHLAVAREQVEVTRMLIECGADVACRDKTGLTPLHVASFRGQVEVARMLVEHGADVEVQDEHGRTPLRLALQEGKVEVARMLIEHGADVEAQDKQGRNPLRLALQEGKVEVARVLIEHGADVKSHDQQGRTPLHLASQKGQVEVARILIERGADVAAQDEGGVTPLHLASEKGHVEVARMLIERGADPTAQDWNRETPLHLASEKGHVEVARMLIERGADPTAQDWNGETPLHVASKFGQVEVARKLIELGADVAAQDEGGVTPLHLASEKGHVEVARMLIERGADETAQDKDGRTPLDLALQENQTEVTSMLLEHNSRAWFRWEYSERYGLSLFRLASQARLANVTGYTEQHANAHFFTSI